ncbi:MAG: hypothetical protein M3209_09840 [Acidobacteriota bacterium]|nr:hypothetical protein [Acidobacteriota bacterium]
MNKILPCLFALCLAACNRSPNFVASDETRSVTTTEIIKPQETEDAPHTIKVSLTISRREDLRVRTGHQLKEGDVLSDRSFERATLIHQRGLLEFALRELKTNQPQQTAAIALPPASYDEQLAAIRRAEIERDQIKQKAEIQIRRFAEIEGLENLPASVIEHEHAKLKTLKLNEQNALAEIELAKAKLATALTARAYLENQRAIETRKEKIALGERRQKLESETVELQMQIAALNERINQLGAVKTPFAGRVVSVEWKGQNNNEITIELLIAVDAQLSGDSAN